MSRHHSFIFEPGVWHGAGKISFSMAEDILDFRMEWTVLPIEDEKIYLNQVIQIEGFSDMMRNHFSISEITSESFHIDLENNIVNRVEGTGILTANVIAWEFRRGDQAFEGYEIYELQPDGSYKVRAEFSSGEGFRTHVQGYIERM